MERQQGRRPEGAPFIDSRVNPDVRAHQQQILDRRSGALPKIESPVAGGPAPRIPRLDGPTQTGVTMEQLANAQRPQQAPPPPSGIINQGVPAAAQRLRPAPKLTPADILPNEAQTDPEYRQGTGSMLAMSQPNLALKYGVHRNGKFIPPQQLVPEGQPQLRAETLRDIQMLNELKNQQAGKAVPGLSADDAAAEREASAGIGGAAARVNNSIGDDSTAPLTAEERARVEDKIKGMDEFDFDTFRQSMMRDILNNEDQKKLIESRLTPLDLTDMIVSGYVTQVVTIIPGKLTFTFRSSSGEIETEIKRLVMQESKTLDVSDRYLLDRYAFMSLAAGLLAINDKPFGDVYNNDGDFDENKFTVKFKRLLKLPLHMLASMGVNQLWFEQRVRKLYVAEKVGNG